MRVAGIREIGAQVELIDVGEPRPLAGDEVLIEVMAAGVGNWDEQRVTQLGARHVVDYHDQQWPAQVREITGGRGVAAAANAAPGGGATAMRAVADGGRLATITSDPPAGERGITVSSIYVRPDGTQLRGLAQRFAAGQLEIPVAADHRLADAAQALAQVVGGHAAGAVVLAP